jgi:1-acyl-sn-glycerol-3-phosphate acyltransferase
VFPVGRSLARILLSLFGRASVHGAYRVPRSGGVLILANHRADVDPMLVQIACPRNIHFMGKSELFDIPVLGWVLRLLGVFPVKRGEPDRAALRLAVDLLKMGEPVCVFPEGQLTDTGRLQEIKPGVALIIRLAAVPAICVGLRETDGIMPYGTLVPRPTWRKVSAMWGEARTFTNDTPSKEILGWVEGQLRELTEEE